MKSIQFSLACEYANIEFLKITIKSNEEDKTTNFNMVFLKLKLISTQKAPELEESKINFAKLFLLC